MIPISILGTASLLPGRTVSTMEVAAAAKPGKDPSEIEARIGIHTRYWVEPGTKMSDLGAEVLRRALDAASMRPAELKRVIFVSSTGGDYINPATASDIIDKVGINNRCDGFDIANACVGFLSALDIGARSVATGLFPVGIVVVEIMSRYITPENPRPFLILGDGAGAVILGPGRPGEGILGSRFGNDGARGGTALIRHPGLTGKLESSLFPSSGRDMADLVVDIISGCARDTVAACGLDLADIEWVLPHQPNGRMLVALIDALGVDPKRVPSIVQDVGSVSAAAIPLSLDRLLRSGSVRPGDRLLMTAIGSGLAYASLLYQTAR